MPMTPLDESHDDFIAFMERSCKKNEAELNLFGSWTTENIQDSHLAVSSHGLYQHREDSMPGLSVSCFTFSVCSSKIVMFVLHLYDNCVMFV